jgi:hypothetical protein
LIQPFLVSSLPRVGATSEAIMDWETLYCPNRFCRLYGVGWPKSALVKNGTSRGYKQAVCRVCGQSVFLRYGTAYFELEAEQLIFDTAIRALAEANSLRATARIVQIDKDTAAAWLDRAARHCRKVMLYLWQHLPVTEYQLDQLWSFVHTKEQNLFVAKLACETYGDAWVWVAFAPIWRLVVAFDGSVVVQDLDLTMCGDTWALAFVRRHTGLHLHIERYAMNTSYEVMRSDDLADNIIRS